MWRSHPSCIRSQSVLKEVHLGSIEAFCYASFVAIANVKRCTLTCSRFAPRYGRLFGPLSPIVISVTIIRRHDVALLSISATIFTTSKPPELTIVELHVVYTRYPTGSTNRYRPAAIIMVPFTWNRRYESSISI
jgi:hypothetical protein